MIWELFATHVQRQCRWFVRPRFREVASLGFSTAEQLHEDLISLNNEFDWIMSTFFLPNDYA